MTPQEFIARYRGLEDPELFRRLTEAVRLLSGDPKLNISTAPMELLERAREFIAQHGTSGLVN